MKPRPKCIDCGVFHREMRPVPREEGDPPGEKDLICITCFVKREQKGAVLYAPTCATKPDESRMPALLKGSEYLPSLILSESTVEDAILDFGSGRFAPSTSFLIAAGRKCNAFDPKYNSRFIHAPDALMKTYDIVFANHVFHRVDARDLQCTLRLIHTLLRKPKGRFFLSYPESSRYTAEGALSIDRLRYVLIPYFHRVWAMERNILLCEHPKQEVGS